MTAGERHTPGRTVLARWRGHWVLARSVRAGYEQIALYDSDREELRALGFQPLNEHTRRLYRRHANLDELECFPTCYYRGIIVDVDSFALGVTTPMVNISVGIIRCAPFDDEVDLWVAGDWTRRIEPVDVEALVMEPGPLPDAHVNTW